MIPLHAEYLNPWGLVRFWGGKLGLWGDQGFAATFSNIEGFAAWVNQVSSEKPPTVQATPDPNVVQIFLGLGDNYSAIIFPVSRNDFPGMLRTLNNLVIDMWQAKDAIQVYAN